MKFKLRWWRNSFMYWLGMTNLSPAAHEFRRMMTKHGYKEIK